MQFLSTPSARRATEILPRHEQGRAISIHALCEEGDRPVKVSGAGHANFYPRPLRGGRRWLGSVQNQGTYFYPRPLRGGRLTTFEEKVNAYRISIHALCEEGDG